MLKEQIYQSFSAKSRILKMTLLLALLAAFSAQQATARNMPDWMKYTWTKKLEGTGDINKKSYYSYVFTIKHTNNKDNKEVRAIFDRSITLSATIYGKPFKKTFNYSQYIIKTIKPGDSESLVANVSLYLIMDSSDWGKLNKDLKNGNVKIDDIVKDLKISYDCFVNTATLKNNPDEFSDPQNSVGINNNSSL